MAQTKIIPRGHEMDLPHGSLPEVISLHLLNLIEQTGGADGPIGKQFIAQPELEKKFYSENDVDPLNEDEFEVAPGLVYKYRGKIRADGQVEHYGRALWTVTRFCSSYCRFCTRGREVGASAQTKIKTCAALAKESYLTDEEINKTFQFIKNHPEINEIIVSGGDPLTAPEAYLSKIILGLADLQKKGDLQIVRIGTRLPVSNPSSFRDWHFVLVAKLHNPYLMVHLNHPAELTPETIAVLTRFRRKCLATVMSQTVLLQGVNDSVQTLHDLFVKAAVNGVRPYYVFQCDPVYWARHFVVPIKKAIEIWSALRPKLSGIVATARLVIDTPHGFGKIPLPEGGAWKVDYSSFLDFEQIKHELN